MLIRPEKPADIEAIYAVNAASFETDLEAGLVNALRKSGRLIVSLVADFGGAVVGHSTASTTRVVQEAMRASVPTFELMLVARNLPVEKFDAF